MYLNTMRSPANLGSYVPGMRSPANLGFFRPNQAFDRGIYGLGCAGRRRRDPRMCGRDRKRGGLGDDTNFLPAGTQLSYTAQWPSTLTTGPTNLATGGPSYVVNSIRNQLNAQWGIVIDSEFDNAGLFSSTGMTLQVHTTRDYGAAADVKSILDNLVGSAVGAPGLVASGYGSNISIVKTGTTPTATGAGATPTALANAAIVTQYQQAVASGDMTTAANLQRTYPDLLGASPSLLTTDPLSWLTANWQWVAIGAGLLVGIPLLKKL